MDNKNFIRIDLDSRVPKYRQIVNSIIEDVKSGKLKVGDRILSINELSELFYVSRDTVEKAYKILKREGIIESKKAIGYYISDIKEIEVTKILFLLNKFSDYKLKIYKSFLLGFGKDVTVDFYVYHYDYQLFINKLKESLGLYDCFVIMPHFKNENGIHLSFNDKVLDTLDKIPPGKLVIVDNKIDQLGEKSAMVYQDFKMDIYFAMIDAKKFLMKYEKLILVFPNNLTYPHPQEIKIGFRKFCVEFSINFEVIDSSGDEIDIRSGDAFIVVTESDLVNLMSKVKSKRLHVGADIGIISYNDTPLKKFLNISVFSTEFEEMGKIAQRFVISNERGNIKNRFLFINRGSL